MERSLIAVFILGVASSHREHKVHNIVLYPDKDSWCNRTPIKQVVNHPGCSQVELDNSVCVGGCFSYSIPRTEPRAPGRVAPYCDSCQPAHASWKQVSLECGEAGPLVKRVEVIESCACSACAGAEEPSETSETEQGLELPQIMALLHQPRNSSVKHRLSHQRLGVLLKVLGGEEDQATIEKILHQMKDSSLKEIVHKVEEIGHIKVDMEKLGEMLASLEPPHRHHHGHHTTAQPSTSPPTVPKVVKVAEEDDFPSPTLDMAPHQLQPAVEGSQMTYQAHPATDMD